MGIIKRTLKLMPKGRTGNVVKEQEEPEEEIEEDEEMEIEETPVEEEVEETFEEIKEVPEAPIPEIKYVVGEIITYAKELGYAVTDTDGQAIECKDKAEAILVAHAIKNEKPTG